MKSSAGRAASDGEFVRLFFCEISEWQPASEWGTSGEDMIRAYIDHWSMVPQVDPAVIDAVAVALQAKDPRNGIIRTACHTEFLKLVANSK